MCDKLCSTIAFPNDVLQEVSAQQFSDISGFANVIGCVDGTQVAIECPSDDEHTFVNRKGFHSLNVLATCDSEMLFLDIVVRYAYRIQVVSFSFYLKQQQQPRPIIVAYTVQKV